MGRVFLLISVISLSSSGTSESIAQDSGLSFLRFGVDAAGMARGDVGVASEHGAFSTYWNPAGISASGSNEVAVSHHLWIADIRTYAVSSKFSLGRKMGVGLYMTATGAGDLEAREGPGEALGFFDAQFVNAGVSLGRNLGRIRVGVTAKYLSERIFVNSANGYAFDFGVQASLIGGGVLLGAAFQNIGKMERLNAVRTKLPQILRVGSEIFPFKILAESDGSALLNTSLIVEVSHNSVSESTQFHVGLEGEVLETVTARAGYISNDTLRKFSFGLGLAIAEITFDYALLPFEEGFGGPAHIVSLVYAY